MKSLFFLTLFFYSTSLASAQQMEIPVEKFDRLESILQSEGEKIRVINFWATWCGPCIKELPHFTEALENHSDSMELYLVSLDYADQLDRVKLFAEKKDLKGEVFILDELDYDTWIDRVDPSWSGAIPATLFLNPATGERIFVEQELDAEELEKYISSLLN